MRACLVHAIEPVKQARQVDRINRVTGVRDTQVGAIPLRLDGQRNLGATVRVPQRVGQQIADGPPNHQAITHHGARPRHPKTKLFVFSHRIVEIQKTPHLVFQRDIFAIRELNAVVRLGQKQHVGHHARQALELLGVGGEDVAVGVWITVLRQRHLGLCQQVADGGAKFVGDVTGEFHELRKILLQPLQHGVEAVGQLGHLHGHGVSP